MNTGRTIFFTDYELTSKLGFTQLVSNAIKATAKHGHSSVPVYVQLTYRESLHYIEICLLGNL